MRLKWPNRPKFDRLSGKRPFRSLTGQERSTQAACIDNQIRPGELAEIVRDASLPHLPQHSR
jgi:hypothetical protein